jgi:hypothetical protein
MATQREKAERFKALHEREGPFVIPNPWDAESARLLAGCGFEALATTSAHQRRGRWRAPPSQRCYARVRRCGRREASLGLRTSFRAQR